MLLLIYLPIFEIECTQSERFTFKLHSSWVNWKKKNQFSLKRGSAFWIISNSAAEVVSEDLREYCKCWKNFSCEKWYDLIILNGWSYWLEFIVYMKVLVVYFYFYFYCFYLNYFRDWSTFIELLLLCCFSALLYSYCCLLIISFPLLCGNIKINSFDFDLSTRQ